MNLVKPYVFLGGISTLYATLLNTKRGKAFADEYTWASVTVGTCIVLGITRLVVPKAYWRKMVLAFTVAGLPLILRSAFNKMKT